MPPLKQPSQDDLISQLLQEFRENMKATSKFEGEIKLLHEHLSPIIKLFHGNGKESLPIRLRLLEESVNRGSISITDNKEKVEEMTEKMQTIIHNQEELLKWKRSQKANFKSISMETLKWVLGIASAVIIFKLIGK